MEWNSCFALLYDKLFNVEWPVNSKEEAADEKFYSYFAMLEIYGLGLTPRLISQHTTYLVS